LALKQNGLGTNVLIAGLTREKRLMIDVSNNVQAPSSVIHAKMPTIVGWENLQDERIAAITFVRSFQRMDASELSQL
jgi:hypothetical protein